MAYDDNNIFAKILRGEIPCSKVYEDDHVLAFNDINPQAKHHVLVIPKGKYVSITDFGENGSAEEIAAVIRALSKVAKQLGVETDGYRVLSNIGDLGGQEVPHLHFHLFGGERLGHMLPKAEKRATKER